MWKQSRTFQAVEVWVFSFLCLNSSLPPGLNDHEGSSSLIGRERSIREFCNKKLKAEFIASSFILKFL